MPCYSALYSLFGVFALISSSAAGPVREASDFNFKSWLNRWDCPMAGGTKYKIEDKTFGILCGWDTKARAYDWGPYPGVTFGDCVKKCADKKGCTVATYTGTCYLKRDARGKGYVWVNRPNDMTAVMLHPKRGGNKDGANDGKEHT